MADEYKIYADPKKDPRLNDDSQPSITNGQQALDAANERLGLEKVVGIPAPADAVDLAYRKALADVDADQVGTLVAEAVKGGTPEDLIDVTTRAGGSPATRDSGDAERKKEEAKAAKEAEAAAKKATK